MKPLFKGRPRNRKIGDKVADIAQLIAEVIDKIFGTDIKNCGSCKKRQKLLNDMFEDKTTSEE